MLVCAAVCAAGALAGSPMNPSSLLIAQPQSFGVGNPGPAPAVDAGDVLTGMLQL